MAMALLSPASGGPAVEDAAQAGLAPPVDIVSSFNIPPQPLVTALEAYGRAAHIQIIYDSEMASGRSSSGAVGRLPARSALELLLVGTGLSASYERPDSVVLSAVPVGNAGRGGEAALVPPMILSLDTLRIQAPAVDSLFYEMYANLVQQDIRQILQSLPALRTRKYSVRLKIWVGKKGDIDRSAIFSSSGSGMLDATILQAVNGLAIGQAPPAGLSLPLHVRISTQLF